jgi:hypothetical protein
MNVRMNVVKSREVRDQRDVESRAGHVVSCSDPFPPRPPPRPPLVRVCFRLISSIDQSIIDQFRSRRPIKLPNMMRSNQPCSQPYNLDIVIDPIFILLLNHHLLSQADTDELMNERRKMSRPISAWEGL